MDISFWGAVGVIVVIFVCTRSIESKIERVQQSLDRIEEKTRVVKDIVEIMEEKSQ